MTTVFLHAVRKGSLAAHWRWYIIAGMLSWCFLGSSAPDILDGSSPDAFLCGICGDTLGALLLFPFLWLMGVGPLNLTARQSAFRAFLSLVICVAFIELFAGTQELFVLREHGRNPGREVWLHRWPPFRSGTIFIPPALAGLLGMIEMPNEKRLASTGSVDANGG